MTASIGTPPRRRSVVGRLVMGVLAVALIVATVLLGRAIAITAPIGEDHRRAFIHQGQLNEPILEHDVEVTVRSVRGGRAYESFGNGGSTLGLYLLVRTRVQALDVSSALRYAELLDDAGRAYSAISHTDTLYNYELLPGIPVEGELLFEVPAAVASQLRLRLSSVTGYWGQYQVMVEVPLQVDDADVADWSNNAAPLTVRKPEVVG